jgi:hypothetical protein
MPQQGDAPDTNTQASSEIRQKAPKDTLSDAEGRFLYHLVKAGGVTGGTPVRLEKIFESSFEELSKDEQNLLKTVARHKGQRTPNVNNKNYISKPMIGRIAAELQTRCWSRENPPYHDPPYISRHPNGFTMEREFYVTTELSAKICMALRHWTQEYSTQEIPVEHFMEAFCDKWNVRPEVVREKLEWLNRRRYISLFEKLIPNYMRVSDKVTADFSYIWRLATRPLPLHSVTSTEPASFISEQGFHRHSQMNTVLEPDASKLNDLAALLNSRFSYLNDPDFGREVAHYLLSAETHGIYCRDLRTTFTFQEVHQERFPIIAERPAPWYETCFDIGIREAVDKICVGNRVRFAAFLDERQLAHHFIHPDFDFAWFVDLPRDANFKGKVSDIFRIDVLEVDGRTIVPRSHLSGELPELTVNAIQDDGDYFIFEIDISSIKSPHNRLRKLRYEFHTLKAKDFRYVSYGTRVLTRGMTTKVEFHEETGINSVVMTPCFSGDDQPKPSDFELKEVSVSGWLLPRSGATFSFRYDKPYRNGSSK